MLFFFTPQEYEEEMFLASSPGVGVTMHLIFYLENLRFQQKKNIILRGKKN